MFNVKLDTVSLALGAALLFALVSTEYDKFYLELGVLPSDVGIQYGTQVGGVAGLTALTILCAGLILFLAWLLVVRLRLVKVAGQHELNHSSLLASLIVAFLIVAYAVYWVANDAADDVKRGEWKEPVTLGPLTVLAVRAYPATVRLAVSETGKALPTLEGPSGPIPTESVPAGRLLYLGHGPTAAVFYDHTLQRAVYLPPALINVVAFNCETRRAPSSTRNSC